MKPAPAKPEKKETPAYEAQQHSKKYLVQALRKKTSGSISTPSASIGGGVGA